MLFWGRWFEPFKADVVIATLPFISSGLWDSSINNLMTHCFECDRWSSQLHANTNRHTHSHTTLTLMMWNLCWHPLFFYPLLQILRRADKNGKYCTIYFLSNSHKHALICEVTSAPLFSLRCEKYAQYFLNGILIMTRCRYSFSFYGNRKLTMPTDVQC